MRSISKSALYPNAKKDILDCIEDMRYEASFKWIYKAVENELAATGKLSDELKNTIFPINEDGSPGSCKFTRNKKRYQKSWKRGMEKFNSK